MGFDIGLGGAFLAGLASFLTPCILPIVPFYLCYMAGVSMDDLAVNEPSADGTARQGDSEAAARKRIFLSSLFFAAGIITVFVALGAGASGIGQQVREHFETLRIIAAVIIGGLGVHFLGIVRIPMLYRQARMDVAAPSGIFGAYLVGLAFAFGWTPCVGPVLAAILFTAGAQQSAGDGATLLFFYGVGMTLPFVVAGLFFRPFMRWMKSIRPYMGAIEKVIGVVLIVFALLIGTNTVGLIAQWMLDTFPAFGTIG